MATIVGIDIGKNSVDVAFFDGNRWHNQSFAQTEQGYETLCQVIGRDVEWVVMEATGSYFLKLASYLTEKNYPVAVLNPKMIHHYAKMRLSRAKTDKKDAQLIARYGMDYRAELSAWQSDAEDIVALRQLQSLQALLKAQKTMTSNHLEALSQHPVQNQHTIEQINTLLDCLKQRLLAIEAEIERLVLKNWPELYQRLLTINGIGRSTASLLLVITCGFSRFANVKEFLSYIGLAPKPFESGSSVRGKSYISKMGNSRIRQLLYLCAWTAKRRKKPCQTLYERLKAKGKPEKVIKIAIAHKLLRQVFAVVFNQQDFDPAKA